MISQLIEQSRELTILDMEASIEHMSRGTVRHVDILLVVVEPYFRALETAGRLAPLAEGLGIQHVYTVANKLRDERDEAAVREYCASHALELIATVPFDDAIRLADRTGQAVLDYAPDSLAVAAIRELAQHMDASILAGEG